MRREAMSGGNDRTGLVSSRGHESSPGRGREVGRWPLIPSRYDDARYDGRGGREMGQQTAWSCARD